MTVSSDLACPNVPGEAEVRAALERVLASASFRASPQLGTFLRFVVDEALNGRGAHLKGYTIAIEALGRDARFNPQLDPIVRVEATRLRRALERYYAGEGLDDTVLIELPRGTYAPVFTWRAPAAQAASAPPNVARTRPSQVPSPLRAGLSVLALVAVAIIAIVPLLRHPAGRSPDGSPVTGSIEPEAATRGLPSGNGMPTIEIDSPRVTGTPAAGDIAAESVTDKIKDAFARFDTINVASDSPLAAALASASGATIRAAVHPDYRLVGSIVYGASGATVRFQLADAAEGTIAWSRRIEAARGDAGAAEDRIVAALTDALLQSYGVIRARDYAKQLASPAGDPRYRCVLDAAESLRSYRPADDAQARACLEHLTSIDPSFGVGFEFLAAIYYREYTLDRGVHPGASAPLDLALRATNRALELNPASGRAYQMLFVVLFARGDLGDAFAAGDNAMALNRYDMMTVAEYGGRLIMTGDVARGMAMLQRAGESGGPRTPWQHFYLFLGCYIDGNMTEAAFQAEQITVDDYPLGLVARAIAANAAGNTDQARRVIAQLVNLAPIWRNDARGELERNIHQPVIVARLLHDLAAAGLPSAS